tara:strand:+ start:317 stop:610 length:294 start_codon:yes stop_codon:yes gene_type:complete
MMKEFMRKFSLVCDWYAEAVLDFEDDLAFKFSIDAIQDTLDEQAGSNNPELYDETLRGFLNMLNLIGREFEDWPLVRGEEEPDNVVYSQGDGCYEEE